MTMDITIDYIDGFVLKRALVKLESLLCDIEFLANERKQHEIRTMADDAIDAVRTARYALKM